MNLKFFQHDIKYDTKRQKSKYIYRLIGDKKDPGYRKEPTKSCNQIEDTHQHIMHLNPLYVCSKKQTSTYTSGILCNCSSSL